MRKLARSIESACEMLVVLANPEAKNILEQMAKQSGEMSKELLILYRRNAHILEK